MAIIPTGAIFKTLTFGTVNSGAYGVYITGEAVYNAPERSVEFVDVPGRNGAVVIDQGHWNNIEVTYPAGCFADSQADFRDNIAAFRNAIVSQIGYQKLTDGYNPDEYRSAVYVSGLEVAPAARNKAGEFTLIFNCKPQRWLTSGEAPSAIAASGNTITNPTLYDSSPLLDVEGYGSISFNGYGMEVYNIPIGLVDISGPSSASAKIYSTETPSWVYNYNKASFATGDTITISGALFTWRITDNRDAGYKVTNSNTGSGSGYAGVTWTPKTWGETFAFPDIQFTVGTNGTAQYTRTHHEIAININTSTTVKSETLTNIVTVYHDSSAGTITFSLSSSMDIANWTYSGVPLVLEQSAGISFSGISGVSTKTVSQDIYIDCEIGEAYTIQGGEPVSLNNSVSIGADLPTLAPGANAITFDNTFTSVKVTPRWWQL